MKVALSYYNPTPEQRRELSEAQAKLRRRLIVNRTRRDALAVSNQRPVAFVIGQERLA